VQVPPEISVTVVPATVQTEGVSDEKLTASPDDAVALTVIGPVPNSWLAMTGKLMVCAACAMTMVKAWVAAGAIPLDAISVPENVPTVVGGPPRTPLAPSSERSGGRLPLTLKVGAGNPDAVTVKPYAVL
jgi:hypothetical protein